MTFIEINKLQNSLVGKDLSKEVRYQGLVLNSVVGLYELGSHVRFSKKEDQERFSSYLDSFNVMNDFSFNKEIIEPAKQRFMQSQMQEKENTKTL